MNHKKAMPATGTKFSASATLFELVFSHVLPPADPPGPKAGIIQGR